VDGTAGRAHSGNVPDVPTRPARMSLLRNGNASPPRAGRQVSTFYADASGRLAPVLEVSGVINSVRLRRLGSGGKARRLC
jgi:hypothetical protein